MLKSIMTWAVLAVGTASGVQAQDTLQVQGTAPNLYLSHTVRKGETFYSLSRAYGVPPKDIATINKVPFEKGVQIGESVHIPLTAANFTQAANSTAGANLHPVYHKVAEHETLYRVSVNYNKVPLDNIRHWNNFSGDGLQKDSYVIIGYVKGGAAAASLPHGTTAPAKNPVTTAAVTTPSKDVAVATPPAREIVKETSKETPAPVKETPVKETPVAPAKTETTAPATDAVTAATTPVSATSGAAFETLYMQQNKSREPKTEKGPGGWFKSNAVLNSGKYYALHNSAPRGTIIKVTNPLNGKFIYAKVLDAIPQLKQNAGLIIKLSDAAMAALTTNETKFYCELSYQE